GAGSDPFRRRALAGIRLSGRAHLPGGARGLPRGRGADHLPRSPHGGKQDVLAHRRRGDGAGAAPALPLGPALPSLRCCWRAALQLAAQGADARVVDVSAYAFAHGVRHTRATLLAWQRDPGAVVGRWAAGAAVAAAGLLAAVWVVSSLDVRDQVMALRPPFVVGDGADVLAVLGRNLLVLALHAMACVAGFIAGSSLPLQAHGRRGVLRWLHEHGGRVAITFVVAATTFSLSAQAYLIGRALGGVAGYLGV